LRRRRSFKTKQHLEIVVCHVRRAQVPPPGGYFSTKSYFLWSASGQVSWHCCRGLREEMGRGKGKERRWLEEGDDVDDDDGPVATGNAGTRTCRAVCLP